jgi:hypothetical protein
MGIGHRGFFLVTRDGRALRGICERWSAARARLQGRGVDNRQISATKLLEGTPRRGAVARKRPRCGTTRDTSSESGQDALSTGAKTKKINFRDKKRQGSHGTLF